MCRVAGEKVKLRVLPGQKFRGRTVKFGKIIIVVRGIEVIVPGDHWPRDKGINPEIRGHVPNFNGIEYTSNVVPIGCANQTFVPVDQLLAAGFKDERELLRVTQRNICLPQVEEIGFEVWIAPVTRGGTLLALCISSKPFRLIAGMNSRSQQQISIVRIPAVFAKINLPRLTWGKKVFLVLQPGPQLTAEIPGIKSVGLLTQPIVQQSSARRHGRWWRLGS